MIQKNTVISGTLLHGCRTIATVLRTIGMGAVSSWAIKDGILLRLRTMIRPPVRREVPSARRLVATGQRAVRGVRSVAGVSARLVPVIKQDVDA
jgi:hypothetical protein